MRSFLGILLLASSAMAAGLHGEYIEARTADVYTGPCFANGEVNLVGNLAVFGWRIEQGSWQGVDLSGLSVVGVVRANGTLGDVAEAVYPAKSVLIVDQKASPEQRLALRGFAQKMGGDLLQDIVQVSYQPIRFDVENNNIHTATATLKAGDLAQVATRAIASADHICHNEEVWYKPLNRVDHAMPAVTTAHSYSGNALGTTWDSPDKRSAFVGSFHVNE